MMAAVEARGRALAAGRVEAVTVRLADRLGAVLPGVRVWVGADGVVLEGRGLARRAFDDPALRWVGSLAR